MRAKIIRIAMSAPKGEPAGQASTVVVAAPDDLAGHVSPYEQARIAKGQRPRGSLAGTAQATLDAMAAYGRIVGRRAHR